MAKAGLLFVGTEDGVVLYSEPGGMGRWLRVGHELRGVAVASLWAWSVNPLTVVLRAGDRLMRSVDGGVSWAALEGVPGGALVGAKGSAGIASLAPDGGLWQSQDAGETWARAGSIGVGGATLLAAAPTNPLALLAAAGAQLFSSADGGASWSPLGSLPQAAQGLLVEEGPAASGGEVFHAAAQGLYSHAMGRWMQLLEGPPAIGALARLPGREPTTLAAIPGGLVARSVAGWAEWEPVGAEAGWGAGPAAIAVAPYHMDTAFAGGGGAVAMTTDRGRTWQRLKGDLPTVQSLAVARLV